MSYNEVRNEKGISIKRNSFASASDSLKSIEVTEFEDGTVLSGGDIIINMQHDGKALQTSEGMTVFDMGDVVSDGTLDAYCLDGGQYVFKKGPALYVYDIESGICFKEIENLPENETCAIYHLSDCFALIFESGSVYTVSDDLSHNITSDSVHIPCLYTLYEDRSEKREDINLFTEYFDVALNLQTGKGTEVPSDLLIDGDYYEVRNSSGEIIGNDSVAVSVNESGGATIYNRNLSALLRVRLRLKHDETGTITTYDDIQNFKKMMLNPFERILIPGVENGKTKFIVYSAESEKNFTVVCIDRQFYASEPETLVFENTEKITSILRYSDEYLLFSPNYIKKMTLTENEGSSPRFSIAVENFKYDVGCDMPKSAVYTDDKIIYANSKAGVFCLDRFGLSQRDMNRNVSANIEEGDKGLFSCSAEDLEYAEAVICSGKYYLLIGDVFYVWDFRYAAPSSSTEKLSESRKMRWLICSGTSCAHIIGSEADKFYFVTEDGRLAYFGGGTSLEVSNSESLYESRDYELSLFGSGAVLHKLSLSLAATDKCTVRCYFDGEVSAAKYTLSPQNGKVELYQIRPEKHKCRKFAFSVSSFGAMRLEGFKIEWYGE